MKSRLTITIYKSLLQYTNRRRDRRLGFETTSCIVVGSSRHFGQISIQISRSVHCIEGTPVVYELMDKEGKSLRKIHVKDLKLIMFLITHRLSKLMLSPEFIERYEALFDLVDVVSPGF